MDDTLDSFAMGFVDGGGGQEGVTVAPIPMDIKYLHAICNFSTRYVGVSLNKALPLIDQLIAQTLTSTDFFLSSGV